MSDFTHILSAIDQGDPHAAEQLLPLVYDELRRLATQKLAQEKPGQTLQATALVHEAYLRLVSSQPDAQGRESWNSRGHFFAAAAEAMRRILVEQARRRHAAKRGGQANREELHESTIAAAEPAVDVIALHDALDRLEKIDADAANLVKLRFFAGLTMTEAAQALGMSVRSGSRPVGVRALMASPRGRLILISYLSLKFFAELLLGLRTGRRSDSPQDRVLP